MSEIAVPVFEFMPIADLPKAVGGRKVDEAVVDALKQSLLARGMVHPPLIVELSDGSTHLLDGSHLIAAHKAAGATQILVGRIRLETVQQAQMLAIENNLIRFHVRRLDEAEEIKKYHDAHPAISREPREKTGRGRPPGGVSETARNLGKPESTTRGYLKIAGLSTAAKKVARQLKLDDNFGVLVVAADEDEEAKQIAILRSHEGRRAKGSDPIGPKPRPADSSVVSSSASGSSDPGAQPTENSSGSAQPDAETVKDDSLTAPAIADAGSELSRSEKSTASAPRDLAPLEKALECYRALSDADRARFLKTAGLVEVGSNPLGTSRDVAADKPTQEAARAGSQVGELLKSFSQGAKTIDEAIANAKTARAE